MDERETRETVVVEETPRVVEKETTIVSGGGDRGGGGLLAAVLVLAVLAILAFLWLSGGFERAADEVGVNVNVEAPKIDVPEKIEVDLPDVTTSDNKQ